jgi:hypothetical protein
MDDSMVYNNQVRTYVLLRQNNTNAASHILLVSAAAQFCSWVEEGSLVLSRQQSEGSDCDEHARFALGRERSGLS